jgi:hypothetical protein
MMTILPKIHQTTLFLMILLNFMISMGVILSLAFLNNKPALFGLERRYGYWVEEGVSRSEVVESFLSPVPWIV